MASVSFLRSPVGSWARFPIWAGSRVSRSLVVIKALSSEGSRCEYGLVSKSGTTCSKSVMGRRPLSFARLCGNACASKIHLRTGWFRGQWVGFSSAEMDIDGNFSGGSD